MCQSSPWQRLRRMLTREVWYQDGRNLAAGVLCLSVAPAGPDDRQHENYQLSVRISPLITHPLTGMQVPRYDSNWLAQREDDRCSFMHVCVPARLWTSQIQMDLKLQVSTTACQMPLHPSHLAQVNVVTSQTPPCNECVLMTYVRANMEDT